MTKVAAALRKPNPKGAPPTPVSTPDNLLRPVTGENVPFQVRIPPEVRREFKAYAAAARSPFQPPVSKSLGALQGASLISYAWHACMHTCTLNLVR